MTNELTQAEFEAHQAKLDALLRASRRGTPERAAAEEASVAWEAAIALPQRTADQRAARRLAIAAAAAAAK